MEKSKANRDELLKLIRGEIQNQIAALGVASKRDVERLERRVLRLETQLKELREAERSRAQRSGTSKTTRKSTAKKASTTSSARRKTT